MQTSGCYNKYFKQPGTFLEDYRRLTDVAAGLGIKGITIAGFLRDSHGGVESAKRVAAYAASRGVAILPCFGTNWYQGPYYEGDHPFNLTVFLRKHPDARMFDEQGKPKEFNGEHGASPAHPAFRQWLKEALQWMFKEFEIGGLNIENGDMLVDFHPLTQALRKDWPADDPEPFFFQGLCYQEALKEACLRGWRSGLEGVSIHGEVTSRHIPAALNYLAFSHFTHWPEDTLREFGRKTLGQVLGSGKDGEDYAVILAHWDAGALTDEIKKLADPARHGFTNRICASNCGDVDEFQRWRFWEWLHGVATSGVGRHVAFSLPV